MQYAYELEMPNGTVHHVISDSNRLSTVSDRAESYFLTSLKSIRLLGEVEEINQHGVESVANMKAEIEHHLGRLEETLITAKGIENNEYDDMRVEILHIKELIK